MQLHLPICLAYLLYNIVKSSNENNEEGKSVNQVSHKQITDERLFFRYKTEQNEKN